MKVNNKIELLTPIRMAMAVVLLIFIIILQVGVRDSKASLADVTNSVVNDIDMSAMNESTNRMFKKFYGLNASDYEGVSLYTPVSNMDVEEILIVKLKDDKQSEEVESAINKRIETQKASFEGYGVEQFDLLEKSVIDVRGNFILFIVHTDAVKADQAFRKSL